VAWPVLKEKNNIAGTAAQKIMNWIKVDIYLKLLFFSLGLAIALFAWIFPDLLHQLNNCFILTILFSALMLLFLPQGAFLGHAFLYNGNQFHREKVTTDKDTDSAGDPGTEDLDDSGFSCKLKEVFERYFSDEALDMPSLAVLMHVSERSLYRKAKSAFGKSPARMLLDFRIERAHKLIRNAPLKPISQVAQEVGLRGNRNFSSAFFERYGILPSEFQKSYKSNVRCQS
jgi:AraC-like DNA-binding protein